MTATLLYINFSPRSESVSRRLAEQFINKWSTLHPDARSISKDYGLSPVEGPSDAWIKANMTPPPERTVDQIDLLAVSDGLIADIHRASHIVISSPMFNFTLPWQFKAYIDNIVRVGHTFSFSPDKGFGPLLDPKKKLLLVWASAGEYPPGTPGEAYDHFTKYVSFIFGFMGLIDFRSVNTGNQWGSPEAVELSIENARNDLAAAADTW